MLYVKKPKTIFLLLSSPRCEKGVNESGSMGKNRNKHKHVVGDTHVIFIGLVIFFPKHA